MKDCHVARLPVAVKTTITLFEPRGIPRDVKVEDQPGSFLKIEALRSNICGNQYADWVVGIVERFNYFSPV